jgi:hypothetical protein
MRQRTNKNGGKKVAEVNPQKPAAKAQAEGMDTTDKICIGIGLGSIVLIVLLLIGMKTGYTPCFFMQQMEMSCGSGH